MIIRNHVAGLREYTSPRCDVLFLTQETNFMGSVGIPDVSEEDLGWGAPVFDSLSPIM